MSKSDPVTLSSAIASKLKTRVKSGQFANLNEAMREAVAALEREESAKLEWLREKIKRSLDDPRPSVPAEEVFAEMDARIATIEANGPAGSIPRRGNL
ncbi:MAG TPA: type II toxin-antitoxin system ParD family antitoxin [Alphaproteobacteria bacterium]|nr:type II toxin-antitoxin system ParD family antitoxin [Alphaproteobacteria bacterium]HAJ47997.1 type II toxin-antitoxin system ParD family antitoxin [Alphaproteobacteria bacterium]